MSLAGKRVLVVEDEPIIALALEDLLIDGGAQPQSASSLEAAAALLEMGGLDAAILDVNVHGQRSYPLAGVLMERGLPFIFATGYGHTVHSARFSAIPTIAKPYTLADIEQAFAAAAT